MKCIECEKEIKKGMKWCSMECKERTYKESYLGSVLAENLEREYKIEWEIKHKEATEKWKASGLPYVEYLLSLGDFKEDKECETNDEKE